MPAARSEVWITGLGLVSSLGEGTEAHRPRRAGEEPLQPRTERRASGCIIHTLAPIDFTRQIPRQSDNRQMDQWQRIGVHAAGLALTDAGLMGHPALLDRIDLCIAAGNGGRDVALDISVLDTMGAEGSDSRLNAMLMTGLRPTLYLGELSNLLAGNISIVHKATGSSRTFKGEEMAGVAAIEDAVSRLAAGQSAMVLVGGAVDAERDDLLLNLELGGALCHEAYRPIWSRHGEASGMIPGSVGAFLVLETRDHAETRGARPYARITALAVDRSRRAPGDALASARRLAASMTLKPTDSALGVLSGASGVAPVTDEEARFLDDLPAVDALTPIRAYGSMLGHGIEAHFPAGIALAAIACANHSFYPPFDDGPRERTPARPCDRILVTALGHWRGEALGIVETVQGGRR